MSPGRGASCWRCHPQVSSVVLLLYTLEQKVLRRVTDMLGTALACNLGGIQTAIRGVAGVTQKCMLVCHAVGFPLLYHCSESDRGLQACCAAHRQHNAEPGE